MRTHNCRYMVLFKLIIFYEAYEAGGTLLIETNNAVKRGKGLVEPSILQYMIQYSHII